MKNSIHAILTGLGAGLIFYFVMSQLIPKPQECPKIEVQQGRDVQIPGIQQEYQVSNVETHF